VPGLEATLRRKEAIRILPGRWKWSPEDPWPPSREVEKCDFFSSGQYESALQRLKKPAVQPTVTVGGQFVTVNMHTPSTATISPIVPGYPAPAPVPLAEPEMETQASQRSGKAVAKTGAPPEREGLMHIFSVTSTSSVPEDLLALPFKMVLIELEEDQALQANPLLVKLLRAGVDVVVVGERLCVQAAMNRITDLCGADMQCSEYGVDLYQPCNRESSDGSLPSLLPLVPIQSPHAPMCTVTVLHWFHIPFPV
jgi:hypothetical protein